MKLKAFAIIAVTMIVFGVGAAAETLNASMYVNENTIIKEADKRFLGVGEDWQGSTDGIHIGNNDNSNLAADYLAAAKNTGFNIFYMRMAGGSANKFYWKDGATASGEGGYTYYGKPMYYGIVEWIKDAQGVNPNVELTFVVNLDDTLENSKDLVRFLTLMPEDEKAVGSDGVNWAQRRIDCGISEPVNISIFELGNELDKINPTYSTDEECQAAADEYTKKCSAVIDAMSSVNSNIKFAAHAKTYPAGNPSMAEVWNDRVIHNLAGEISYIALHDYYYPGSMYWFKPTRIMGEIVSKTYDLPEEQRPKVLITEHAVWADPNGENNQKRAVTSLVGALGTAAFINNASVIEAVAGINYYGLTAGPASLENYGGMSMGIFRRFTDGKIYLTGVGEIYKMLAAGLGDNIVHSSVSGNDYVVQSPDIGYVLSSSAHTGNDGSLYLTFINQNKEYAQNISISAQGKYKLYKEYVLTGEGDYADNNPETPEGLFMKTRLVMSENQLTSYTVPAQTMIVLHLVPMDREYETDKNAEMMVTSEENGVFDVECTLFDNKPLAEYKHLVAFVVKSGDEKSIDNAVYFTQAEVERQRTNFKINMPKACGPGSYDIIIAAGGTYESINVDYNGAKSVSVEKMTTEIDGSNLSVNIDFSDKFPSAKRYHLIIAQSEGGLKESFENGKVVYVKEFSKNDGNNIKILMPGLSDNGKYTVFMVYDPLYGEKTNMITASFDYRGSAMPLTSTGKITNQNDEVVSHVNLAQTTKLKFNVNNTAEEDIYGVIIIGGYDSEGRFTYAKVSEEKKFVKGINSAEIETAFADVDISSLKIYIWESIDGARPLSRNVILDVGMEN